MVYDVLIAGAGVIGGMVARELSRYNLKICLLEKENDVACGASKANSGIVHGGFDPEPDTLKAELNVEGVPLLYEAAKQLHVPCINNGSIVCAFGREEEKTLNELYERGIANGVSGMKILSGDEAREIEPNLSPNITAVLQVTSAGIVCPYDLTVAAVGNAMDNGAELRRNFKISSIESVSLSISRSPASLIISASIPSKTLVFDQELISFITFLACFNFCLFVLKKCE